VTPAVPVRSAMPPPAWVQVVDSTGGLTVLELDEALVDGAPWAGLGTQLGISVALHLPDPTGQPYDDEHAVLLALQASVVAALGPDGRLVATITMDGVRELIAYVRTPGVVQVWQSHPPEGLGSHDVEVTLLEDPTWLGLRELAGLLGDEPPLRPPEVEDLPG